jgi:hypothetical protein
LPFLPNSPISYEIINISNFLIVPPAENQVCNTESFVGSLYIKTITLCKRFITMHYIHLLFYEYYLLLYSAIYVLFSE